MNHIRHRKQSSFTVTDLFCGAGGSSYGAARLGMEIKLALNHWERAIETHNQNFPDTQHDCVDVSEQDPRRYFPTDVLIASPECTNHSLAKGKKRVTQHGFFDKIDPSAVRSRATMWDVPRFAEFHDYNFIVVENVVDARNWRLFTPWLMAMHALDYDHEIVYMNNMFAHINPYRVKTASDFVPQSRDRMYVVFWKKGNNRPDLSVKPLAWCDHCDKEIYAVQSWKKANRQFGRYGSHGQYLYRCPTCANEVHPYRFAVANAIDWSEPIGRISERKRPLKDKTILRIRNGLDRYKAQGRIPPFLVRLTHGGTNNRSTSVEAQAPTQTTRQDLALIAPTLVNMRNPATKGGKPYYRIVDAGEPAPTQVAAGTQDFLFGVPLQVQFRQGQDAVGIEEPAGTVTAGGIHAAITVVPAPTGFMMSYYSNGKLKTLNEPSGTMTSRERAALVLPSGKELEVDQCYFRMIQPREVQAIQGFPADYIVKGNKKEQVRQLGNANPPESIRLLLDRCLATI